MPQVEVSFEQATYTVAEGSSVDVKVKVKLSGDPERTVTIPLTDTGEGGATASDYSGVPATVTFDAGDTEKTFTFTAASDTVNDDGESVVLGFGATLPAGVTAGSTDETTVSITENETAGVTIDPTALTVTEGDATGADYTVVLDTQPSADVTVTVSGYSGTEINLSDTSLTFTSDNWNQAQNITVTAWEDDDTVADAEITLTHAVNGTGDYAGITAGSVTVTITEDDTAVTASFEKEVHHTIEGAHGAGVEVILSAPLEWEVTIPVTVLPESTAGAADYTLNDTGVSGTPGLTFSPGTTFGVVFVKPAPDDEDEDVETVVLGFGALPGGVSAGLPSQSRVEIRDPVRVSFGASQYTATEGGDNAMVTVLMSDQLELEAAILLTAEGGNGATEDDWSGVPERLIFAPGETSKTFTVTAVDDTVEDDGETVKIGFQFPRDTGFIAVSPATATVTLMNVEAPEDCDAFWCGTLKLVEEETPSAYRSYFYHPATPGSSLSDDRFNHQGTDYTFINMNVTAYPVESYYGSPYNRPGDSELSLTMGSGGEDWYSARGAVPEEHYLGWTLYFGDMELRFSDALIADGNYFMWQSAEWSKFDNSKSVGEGYSLRIEQAVAPDPNADIDPPQMESATVRGETLTMTFNEDLQADPLPSEMIFFVTINEIHGDRQELSEVSVSGKQVILTLARPAPWNSIVFLHLLDMPSPHVPLRDLAGNRAGHFENYIVTNTTPSPTRMGEVLPQGSGELRATWFPPSYNGGSAVESYKVQWKAAADSWDTPADFSEKTVIETTHTITGLTTGVEYTVRVIAVHGTGDGTVSDEVTATPDQQVSSRNSETPSDGHEDSKGSKNSPAKGVPTIVGSPLAEQTLTADVASIEDADGLARAKFTYQWLIEDSGSYIQIEGATASTYTLSADDEGKPIKVRVAFIDDSGNQETLTSLPVIGTSEAPIANSPATGLPTITGTAQAGETLTAGTSGIADADGLTNVSYSYQWLADDTDILGAIESTYNLTDDEVGKTVKVRVTFTDDADNEESLTSAATDAVAAAPSPLTASLPDSRFQSSRHLGAGDRPQVIVAFSLAVASFENTTPSVSLTGAAVSSVRRHEEDGLENAWIFFLDPDGNEDIVFRLVAGQPCDSGGICTEDGGMLSGGVQISLPGPEEEAVDDQQTPQSPPRPRPRA